MLLTGISSQRKEAMTSVTLWSVVLGVAGRRQGGDRCVEQDVACLHGVAFFLLIIGANQPNIKSLV